MKKPPTNVAHSIRDRLLKAAKASGEEFTYALTRYGLERLLARLAASPHSGEFVLKGAMLFRVWSPTLHRPTKDLDLLGSGVPSLERLAKVFADVCGVTVEEDGMLFDAKATRAMNCANCAVATDAAISGSPASAIAGAKTSAADLSAHYGTRWSPACTANDIEGALKTAGDGTRGIVFGEVPARSYGHFFNVVNDGGVVRYLDGQPGAMTSPAGYSRLWLLPTN